jgi:ATP adenylyltransferase
MERVWAPWRGEYIKQAVDNDSSKCIFCDFLRSKSDKENLVLYKNEFGLVMMNKYPYNNGHIMVTPSKHAGDLGSLSEKEYIGFSDLLRLSVKVLQHVYAPQGINVGMNLGKAAGAGVDTHIHYHVVPRWNGDTNFMPILAETKVISEHLMETYDRLSKGFKEVVK